MRSTQNLLLRTMRHILVRRFPEKQGQLPLEGGKLAYHLRGEYLKYLRSSHLSARVKARTLASQLPESPNHQLQACQLPKIQ